MDIKPINDYDGKGWLFHGDADRPRSGIVLHATAGTTLAGAVSTLRQKRLGYHFVIEANGTVWKCAPYKRTVGHAGRSEGWAGASCNAYTIGVSFVHPNDGNPISAAAIQSCKELCKILADAEPGLEWLTTHYAITVQPSGRARKTDPRDCPVEAIATYAGLKPWKPSWAKRFAL
jgi:N-acetyl-anhydromuramyl-L-alanine amidase AmpD